MAKISNSHPKNSSDAYIRLFGDEELGKLITKIQSTVISSGTELENIILAILRKNGQIVDNIDDFLTNEITIQNNIYAFPKKALKKSNIINYQQHQPDFVILRITPSTRHCHIIELKTTSIHICAFNQLDKQQILIGLKSKFLATEILTGQEFCDLLNINYDELVLIRQEHQQENLEFFVQELLKITAITREIDRHNLISNK